MKKKRILFALVLLLTVGGSAWWWVRTHAAAPSDQGAVRMATVDRGEVRLVVNATGKVSSNYDVDIKCKASGEVISLPYDVSDVVKKGALVLELDPVDEQRRVDQMKSALASAEWRLGKSKLSLQVVEETLATDRRQAEINLESAQIKAAELRSKANRSQQLFEKKLISDEEHETVMTVAKLAETSVEESKNTIEKLKTRPLSIEMDKNEVKLAEAAVETAQTNLQEAQQRLKETKVVAPIDGVVTTRPAQIGTIVSSGITNTGGGTSIMTLSDLSRLFVLVPVDEADIGKLKLEQKVVVKCDAFPDTKFEGKILRTSPKGLLQSGVVTFEAKIEILGVGKELLRPEMTADVEVIVAHREEVLRLPSEAVFTRAKDRQRYVLIPVEESATQPASPPAAASAPATTAGKSPATASASASTAPAPKIKTIERDVTIGVDDGAFCEIVSGLKLGEKVVISAGGQEEWAKLKPNESEY